MYDKTVRRRRAVLGLLVVCSLILLTAYFGERTGGALHNVQKGIVEVVSPIQDGASRALKPVRDLFGWVGDTVSAKGDLKSTRADRDRWRQQAIANMNAVHENAQLRGLLGLDDADSLQAYGPVTARTIGSSPTLWYAKIEIDKGSSSGIRADQPVLAADGRSDTNAGVIGKVESVTPGYSVVRLITDSTMTVPARVVSGTASGDIQPSPGNPHDLVMQNVPKDQPVATGAVIVTKGTTSHRSDLNSVFPPGLAIGRVTKVDDPGASDQLPHVRPFVDVRRVDWVQVLTKQVNGNR